MKSKGLDKNVSPEAVPQDMETVFYDVKEPSFSLYGLQFNGASFKRMPLDAARSVSACAAALCGVASGGRVTFETDSPYVVLAAEMTNVNKMPHFTTLGSCGFDLYADGRFYRSFIPDYRIRNSFSGMVRFSEKRDRCLLLHFPLYSEVVDLRIGLAPGSTINVCRPYENMPPIVYYGSSITQGGCASRPGNAYPALIAQRNHIDFVNPGFSGNARGEAAMAHYIAWLAMSAFVLDYDHNAPDTDHLRSTHAAFYRIIRQAQPHLPAVFVTRPDFDRSQDALQRRHIVYETYRQAVQNGEPVQFVHGGSMWDELSRGAATVDGCHPNDLGFYLMAQSIHAALQKAMGLC